MKMNWLIIGGIGLAAVWYLSKKKKTAPTVTPTTTTTTTTQRAPAVEQVVDTEETLTSQEANMQGYGRYVYAPGLRWGK